MKNMHHSLKSFHCNTFWQHFLATLGPLKILFFIELPVLYGAPAGLACIIFDDQWLKIFDGVDESHIHSSLNELRMMNIHLSSNYDEITFNAMRSFITLHYDDRFSAVWIIFVEKPVEIAFISFISSHSKIVFVAVLINFYSEITYWIQVKLGTILYNGS